MSDAALVPDLNEARRFLQTLERDGRFCFQTFDDSKEKRGHLARTFALGTLDDHAAELTRLNQAGAGVFVTVNRTDGGARKAANVTSLRALFIDGDGISLPSCVTGKTWHCEPSMIVMRDAMHWHAYWLLHDGGALEEFRPAQKRLIAYYGSDDAIHDLSRVLRLPGFWHRKGEPREVRVSFVNDNPLYALPVVLQGLPEFPSASAVVGGGDFRATVSPAVEGEKGGKIRLPRVAGELTETERAERYALKIPAPASGDWNNQLKNLCTNLCSQFKASEQDVARIALQWSRTVRTHDAGKDAEAQRTIQSTIAFCLRTGLWGNNWRPLKVKGSGRPLPEYDGGRETTCDTDGLESECLESRRFTPKPLHGRSRRSDDEKKSPPSELVSGNATSIFAGADAIAAEGVPSVDCPDDDDPCEPGTLRPKLPVVPSGDAANWFNNEFERFVGVIDQLSGTKRDAEVLKLLREISKRIIGVSIITRSRIKERLCKKLDLGRRDFDKAMDEASLATASKSSSGYMGLAREFLADLKENERAWIYWLEDWYQWTSSTGSYRRQGKRWIESQVAIWIAGRGVDPTTGVMGDFFVSLRALCILHDDIKDGTWLGESSPRNETPAIYQAMRNGILNLCDRAQPLIPHTPDYFTLHAAPFDFDPAAWSPKWADAAHRWHATDSAAYVILQDWMGYLYIPFNPHKRFIVNVGPGNDGKSVFSSACRMLIGERNCAAVGLEQFDPSKTFGLTPLLGTRLNIIGDANHVEKVAEGTLKSLTGNDVYTFDRKNRDPITDVWAGKIMINANEIPNWRGRSDALYNRMLTLNWNPIPASDINTNLMDELKAELSGIFNWAMVGFDRVRERPFAVVDNVKEWLEQTRDEAQHELGFFEQSIDVDAERLLSSAEWASQDEIVAEYVAYCKSINVKAFCHANTLMKQLRNWIRRRLRAAEVGGEQVEEFVGKFHVQQRKLQGKRMWIYKGITLLKNEVAPGALSYGAS